MTTIHIDKIIVPVKNVRSDTPEISELAASIKRRGLIQPIVVRPNGDGTYTLTAGQRRYYAAREAGLTHVPYVERDEDVTEAHTSALIENVQRVDMNPLDVALGIKEMMDNNPTFDQSRVAVELGKSPGWVSQHLGLLRMPDEVQREVLSGGLDLSRARILTGLKDSAKQVELLASAKNMSLTAFSEKVDHEKKKLEKEEKKAAAAAEASGKAPAKKKASKAKENAEETLAAVYTRAVIQPRKAAEIQNLLVQYANKLEAARSDETRLQYKYILAGLEMAAEIEKNKKD